MTPPIAMPRRPVALALCLAAALPFERIGSATFGGMTVRPSQVILLVTLAVLVVSWIRKDQPLEWRRPEYAWLAAFFGIAALSLAFSASFSRSLAVLIFTAFTASLAVVLPHVIRTPESFARVRKVVLISAAVVGIFGLLQFFGDMLGLPPAATGLRSQYTKAILGFTRVQSTTLEPLYFANYLLIPISLAAAWLLHGTERRTRAMLLALLAILLLNVFLASSRGGYAGLIAVGLVLAWRHRSTLGVLKKFAAAAAVGVAAVAIGFFLLSRFAVTTRASLSETFFRHVTTLTDGAAFDERFLTGSTAWDAFLAHPWLGIGFGGYGPHVAAIAHLEPAAGWAIVNNETLELLAETGIAGLAAFVGFLIVTLSRAARSLPDRFRTLVPIREGVLAAMAGILVQYQTFSTLYVMHVWFAIGLLIAVSRTTEEP